MTRLLRDASALRTRTPLELLPAAGRVSEPLPQGSVYAEYTDYPAGAVQLYTQVCNSVGCVWGLSSCELDLQCGL